VVAGRAGRLNPSDYRGCRLFDSFHFGAALVGIAAGKIGDQPTLVLATADKSPLGA